MAPVGSVTVTFTLDQTECQGSDPVTGVVSLHFRPTSGTQNLSGPDLFGLLKLRVLLQGRMLVNVAENRTSHACIFYNETRILFAKYEELVNGSFRSAANETTRFPFQVCFPPLTDTFEGNKDVVPPTLDRQFSAIAAKQVGKHHVAILIVYTVRVEAEIPAIDVNIYNDTPPKKVTYQPLGEKFTNTRNEFTQTLQLQSYSLLPEQDRPNLLEKTKAKINNEAKPAYSFSVTCVGYPDTITIGEEVHFELRIRTETEGTTADQIPEVSLGDCQVEVVARTQVYATNSRGGNSAQIDGSYVEATLPLLRQDQSGTFKKEYDFTKKLVFAAVPNSVPISFLIKKVCRTYKLKLDLQFIVAGQKVSLYKAVNIRVLPPMQQTYASPMPGPSRDMAAAAVSRYTDRRESEDLPKYDEIGHSAPPFQPSF